MMRFPTQYYASYVAVLHAAPHLAVKQTDAQQMSKSGRVVPHIYKLAISQGSSAARYQ